jgi:hypothetical protein
MNKKIAGFFAVLIFLFGIFGAASAKNFIIRGEKVHYVYRGYGS